MRSLQYFDTSYLIPLVMREPSSDAVIGYVGAMEPGEPTTSAWTRVEFASALGIRVRNRLLTEDEAADAEAGFAELLASFTVLAVERADMERAARILQDRSLGLRGGDALHVAIAGNHEAAAFLSLDKTLLRAARRLGAPASTGVPIVGYDD